MLLALLIDFNAKVRAPAHAATPPDPILLLLLVTIFVLSAALAYSIVTHHQFQCRIVKRVRKKKKKKPRPTPPTTDTTPHQPAQQPPSPIQIPISTPNQDNPLTDVVNSLMMELYTIPSSTDTIFRLITNNLRSPVLAEIHHLSLPDLSTKQMARLVPALAKMSNLVSLALPRSRIAPTHLKLLFTACPALSKLQSLDLGGVEDLSTVDLKLLSQSTTLTNLTSLDFRDCINLTSSSGRGGPNGLIALFTSPVVENLTHLNLSCADIDDLTLYNTLTTSPFLSNLVSLDLSGTKIPPDAVTALARSTTLMNLTHLNLAGTALGDEAVAQLFSKFKKSKKVKSLNLSSANITLSSLKVLAKASPYLTELILKDNPQLGPFATAFIASQMPHLVKLDLSHCAIPVEGLNILTSSATLSNLRELNLCGNMCAPSPQTLRAFANSPVLSNLTHLDLSYTHYGPGILMAIAQSAAMSTLQSLKLRGNKVGDEGVIALAQSTSLTNLTWLNLGNNLLGPEGIAALCTSPVVSKLKYLCLDENPQVGNSIAPILAAPSSTLYCLLDLDLQNIQMDDPGVSQLLAATNLVQLDSLKLGGSRASVSTKDAYWARFDGKSRTDRHGR